MTIAQGIDELIEAGWRVLYSDFDDGALQEWKRKAAFWMNVLADPCDPDAKVLSVTQQKPSRDSTQGFQRWISIPDGKEA